MTCDEIENYLIRRIESLDPKIQERFVYVFDRGDGIKGKEQQFANCIQGFKPPVITFFTKVLEKHNFKESNLDGLINHEIVHVFGFGEKSAEEWQDTKDFTKHA